MSEQVKPPQTSVAPEAVQVQQTVAQPAVADVKVGDWVLYVRPSEPVALLPAPRVAVVTKVHGLTRPGRINLVHFQAEKGEDPVMFEEDVMYNPDVRWPGRWSPLPK